MATSVGSLVGSIKTSGVPKILYRGFSCYQTHSNRISPGLNALNWYRSRDSSSNNNNNGSSSRLGRLQQTCKRQFRSTATSFKAKNPYDVLGVSMSASKEEIKSKYREMAKKCHPDLNRNDKNAEEKFKEITAAYEILESDSKRRTYDNYGDDGQESERSGWGQGGGGGGGFHEVDHEDIFSFFHSMSGKRNSDNFGKDITVKLRLTFLEAVLGCTKEVRYDVGSTQQKNKRGRNKSDVKSRVVDVKIPAGVDTGMHVQMDGQGAASRSGNNVGNLIIELLVQKDNYFRREKSDVHTDLNINIEQAILGTSVDVRTLDGTVTMKINPGTQPGSTFSITGKGISKVNSSSSKRGNHYVKVQVTIPTSITDRQKELLLEFAKESPKPKEREDDSKAEAGAGGYDDV